MSFNRNLKGTINILKGSFSVGTSPLRRGLVDRPSHSLICRVKFNDKVLSTDPTPHKHQPLFEQELAWDINRSIFRLHKLQRSPIKIELLTVSNTDPSCRESLGFFLLGLRSCTETKTYRWHRLLHCPVKEGVSLFCALYLDSSTGSQEFDPNDCLSPINIDRISQASPDYCFSLTETRPAQTYSLLFQINRLSNLQSLLHPSTSVYDTCLTFSLTGAFSFPSLPLTEYFNQTDRQAFLCYKIDLSCSSLDQFSQCLASPLVVSLVVIDSQQTLAKAHLPLTQLLPISPSQPTCLRGNFVFQPIASIRSNRMLVHEAASLDVTLICISPSPTLLPSDDVEGIGHPSTTSTTLPYNLPAASTKQQIDQHSSDLTTVTSQLGVENYLERASTVIAKNATNQEQSTVDKTNVAPSGLLEGLRRFCLTIELTSLTDIQAFDIGQSPLLYTSYTYPLFATDAPVKTSPPISIGGHEGTVVLLPNGCCAFEFACSWHQLRTELTSTPLLVDLLDARSSSSELSNDHRFVGRASIDLSTVLCSPVDSSSSKLFQTSGVSPIQQAPTSSSDHSFAQLAFKLSLTDKGPHLDPAVEMSKLDLPLSSTRSIDPTDPDSNNNGDEAVPSTTGGGDQLRQTPEYKTAFELELWRAEQETSFLNELATREQTVMTALASEWQKRDQQRDALFKKTLTEYQSLKEQLKAALKSLNKRQGQLVAGERELGRLRDQLEQKTALRQRELDQAADRQVKSLQTQLRASDQQAAYWKSQAEEWESRFNKTEAKLQDQLMLVDAAARKKQTRVSEAKAEEEECRRQLSELKSRLADTQRLLDEEVSGKAEMNRLVRRTLDEVEALKRQVWEQREETRRDMVCPLVVTKSIAVNTADQGGQNLVDFSCDYNEQQDHSSLPLPSNDQQSRRRPEVELIRLNPEGESQQLARLIDERDSLLDTGLYDCRDRIIQDLDEKIRSMTLVE